MTIRLRMGCRSLLILSLLAVQGFAVDRTKFRTCDQTSFCRRHRGKASASLYKYKLEKDSLNFHLPTEGGIKEGGHGAAEAKDSSLWNSLSTRILGSKGDSPLDPYVRGPPPTLTGTLVNTAPQTSTGTKEELQWSVHALADGLVRMRITEVYGSENKPYENARVTYDELILIEEKLQPAKHAQWIRSDSDEEHKKILQQVVPEGDNVDNFTALQYGDAKNVNSMLLLVRLEPFSVYLYRENDLSVGPIMTMNTQDLMHFEVRRLKDQEEDAPAEETKTEVKAEKKHEKEIVGYWEDGLAIYADGTREEKEEVEEEDASQHRKLTESDLDREGMWEEKFSSHHDSKPHGPMSVGMGVSFPNSNYLFGLPEHASSTVLKDTQGEDSHYKQPYRLYNLDVFEYELDETMALYGHVPLIVSHSKATGTSGFFWLNPTETYVDVNQEDSESKSTHWISESGVVDMFLLPGSTPTDLYRQYSKITGTMPLPPMFSLGYHQCRWNYKDEKDVFFVHDTFEELDYPYDVLWLDIEHTNGKRYFTWDKNLFPNPKPMQERLWSQGRRMVTIIDPHIFRDDGYRIHKDATSKGLYIKDKDGKKDFDGWCWPGSSSYLDFTTEKVRSWWADQFGYDRYEGSTPSLFTWNDMNEPSVFNGPEVSMQKDLLNLNGEEHREWHNLYGMLFHKATGMGQVRRNKGEDIRPFVLTRSFFAGSQRYGAIWTGDNLAEWSHLVASNPMLLSLNVAALSFVGADVGGFFGNTDAELMTRWMQAGAYQPFFRGHAHHDAKRREPWMFGDETMRRLRNSAMARYALLPMWYTVFNEAGVTGMPVMRTMWMQYPQTEQLFALDDQYLIGSDLLVRPVTASGATDAIVHFPTKDTWYDVDTSMAVSQAGVETGVNTLTVESGIDKIPVYQRGGSILPRKLRLRRSAAMMKTDPYSLYIALDPFKEATGSLYMDDEETFGHEKRAEYAEATFKVIGGSITNTVTVGTGWESKVGDMKAARMIERIVVMGVDASPKSIACDGAPIEFEYDSVAKVLILRKPSVSALSAFEIKLE
jgi:alpha 1,3-glucosidase